MRNCFSGDVDELCYAAGADSKLIGLVSSVSAFGDNNLRVFPLFDSGDYRTSITSGTKEPERLAVSVAFSLNETNKTFIYYKPNVTGFSETFLLPSFLGRGRVWQKVQKLKKNQRFFGTKKTETRFGRTSTASPTPSRSPFSAPSRRYPARRATTRASLTRTRRRRRSTWRRTPAPSLSTARRG